LPSRYSMVVRGFPMNACILMGSNQRMAADHFRY